MDLTDLPDDARVTLTVGQLRNLLRERPLEAPLLVAASTGSGSSALGKRTGRPILGVRVWYQKIYNGWQVIGVTHLKTRDQTRDAERLTPAYPTLLEAAREAKAWAGKLDVPLLGQAQDILEGDEMDRGEPGDGDA
jgi:hypothetical protein